MAENNEKDYLITMYNVALDRDEQFYLLANVDYEDKLYAVLQPAEEIEDIPDGQVLIMEIHELEGDEAELLPIEDEDLLQKVFDKFVNDFTLEDECGCECGCGCENHDESCCGGEHHHDGCGCGCGCDK